VHVCDGDPLTKIGPVLLCVHTYLDAYLHARDHTRRVVRAWRLLAHQALAHAAPSPNEAAY